MELTKQDTLKAKGIAIMGMVMLHLFCRLGELPYTPLIWIGATPLVYYIGLFGDMCVPIYCFCSGYAHYLLQEKEGSNYCKRIPVKLLKFLCNFWIVVVLFSALGLIFGDASVPGSLPKFLGNIFLYQLSYNGAWWFVLTYCFLLLLSPLLARLVQKVPGILLLPLSGIVYCGAYLFRFKFVLEINNDLLDWIWTQLVLLGTSQFGYIIGMACRKDRWISKLRDCLSIKNDGAKMHPGGGRLLRILIVIGLPLAAFAGHCVIQSSFVAPFTALAAMTALFLLRLPACMDKALLFLGKHSMNIWLVHMFFYLALFEDLVFAAKYPVLVAVFMFALCVLCSMVINWIYHFFEKMIAPIEQPI